MAIAVNQNHSRLGPDSIGFVENQGTDQLIWFPGYNTTTTVSASRVQDNSSIAPVAIAAIATIASWVFLPTLLAVIATATSIFLAMKGGGSPSTNEQQTTSTPRQIRVAREELPVQPLKLSQEEYELFRVLFERSGASISPLCPQTKSFMLVPTRAGGVYHEYTALQSLASLDSKDIELLQPGDTSLSDAVLSAMVYLTRINMAADTSEELPEVKPISDFSEITQKLRENQLSVSDSFAITHLLVTKINEQRQQLTQLGQLFHQKELAHGDSSVDNPPSLENINRSLLRFRLCLGLSTHDSISLSTISSVTDLVLKQTTDRFSAAETRTANAFMSRMRDQIRPQMEEEIERVSASHTEARRRVESRLRFLGFRNQ